MGRTSDRLAGRGPGSWPAGVFELERLCVRGPRDGHVGLNSPEACGASNESGPMITVGGLIFNGATLGGMLHAYALHSGAEVWRAALPAPGIAAPW